MSKTEIISAIRNARDFLDSADHWKKGDWYDGEYTQIETGNDDDPLDEVETGKIGCACLLGAVYLGKVGHDAEVMTDLFNVESEAVGEESNPVTEFMNQVALAMLPHIEAVTPGYMHSLDVPWDKIVAWNDAPLRQHSQVLELLDLTLAAKGV